MKKILLLVIGSFVFAGCENKEPINCYLPNPSISSNSPVMSGDEIELSSTIELSATYEPAPDVVYEWTGPNGFQSNLPNPIIPDATVAMEGTYKLKITRGICTSEEISTTVDIINNIATCDQNDDTATFTGIGVSNFYFSSTFYENNELTIYAGDSNSQVRVTFAHFDSADTGAYTIVDKNTALTHGNVHVEFIHSDVLHYYAKSGDVMVSKDLNNNITIKFCSVPFSFSTNTSTDTVGSALFTYID
ncbi:MAG TPA: hypothetical protein VLB74_05960 [Flavobacterium sp.]|uniref:hypothetical protein n=1 Tax=Flavobacterium sp. TaxID=239 RepID=UPI002B78A192|nr:hypothetical protein [Flavobacterium sp.]HSD14172.1 hypothetical protein [Flavobacterium sp.]